MTHKFLIFFYVLLTALSLCGCSPTEPENAEDFSTPAEGVILSLPRSSLDNMVDEGYQHVKTVHLYIFEGNGNDALCVASEAVDWSALAAPDEGVAESRERSYKIQYRGFTLNHDYTLLAVGLDANAGNTYNLPDGIRKGVTTLGNAFATLRSGGSLSDITSTELFGGIRKFTYANPYIAETVILNRRVAGVTVDCANIPAQVHGRDVAAVRLRLFKTPTMKVFLSEGIHNPDFADLPFDYKNTDDTCVVLEGTPDEERRSAFKGYLLPMGAPVADYEAMTQAGYKDAYFWLRDYTFRIELTDADGYVLQSYRIRMNESVDGENHTPLPGGVADPYRYHIEANHLYKISCDFAAGGEGEVIVVGEWQYDVDVEID